MSGLRPHTMTMFYARLHRRGVYVEDLAKAVKRSRPTITRILNGSRRRGPVWNRLKALLKRKELALLDVALRDPWNKQRIAKRPKWKNSFCSIRWGKPRLVVGNPEATVLVEVAP